MTEKWWYIKTKCVRQMLKAALTMYVHCYVPGTRLVNSTPLLFVNFCRYNNRSLEECFVFASTLCPANAPLSCFWAKWRDSVSGCCWIANVSVRDWQQDQILLFGNKVICRPCTLNSKDLISLLMLRQLNLLASDGLHMLICMYCTSLVCRVVSLGIPL